MTGTAPDWLYPLRAGQTLSSNEWVEFHLHRFLASRFLAHMLSQDRRDVVGTAVVLWAESYRQDPAGTLPDDDPSLARLAGFGRDLPGWQAMRGLVLWGWSAVEVRDEADVPVAGGFLGHQVVAQIAATSWRRKSGKVQGRAAAAQATLRSRVKDKLEKLGRGQMVKNPDVVAQVADWLVQADLWATPENVAEALHVLHGLPKVVPVARR